MKIKKTVTSGARHAGGPAGNATLHALLSDPTAMKTLAQVIANQLVSSQFGADLISAVESVIRTKQATAAGHLLAGVVSALVLNGSNQPITAIVTLSGAATASPVYVPPHLQPFIAASQEIWVEAINGNMSDLVVVSIRNVTTLVTAFLAAFTATNATLSGALAAGSLSAASGAISGLLTAGSATVSGLTTAGTLSSDAGTITSDGAGNLALQGATFGTGMKIKAISFFSGTGTGTYSHALGQTPSYVAITQLNTGTTVAVGSQSYGSSTVGINIATATSFIAMAVALA